MPGVIDQNGERFANPGDLCRDGFGEHRISHVTDDRGDAGLRQLLQKRSIAIQRNNLRTAGGEKLCRGAADPARRSGDEGEFVLNCHVYFLRFRAHRQASARRRPAGSGR